MWHEFTDTEILFDMNELIRKSNINVISICKLLFLHELALSAFLTYPLMLTIYINVKVQIIYWKRRSRTAINACNRKIIIPVISSSLQPKFILKCWIYTLFSMPKVFHIILSIRLALFGHEKWSSIRNSSLNPGIYSESEVVALYEKFNSWI